MAHPIALEPTSRQQAVLDAVLAVFVEQGNRVTMDAVAKRASCSKETLYKWFGDRNGMLDATVRWQAARVGFTPVDLTRLDRPSLVRVLEEFAANWLSVISSQTSLALNRVAIGQAAGDADLGRIVLENGRFALGERLKPVLEAGREAGLLDFSDSEEAFRTFFGLFARDVQIRLLLGDLTALAPGDVRADAARATEQFFALYGAQPAPKGA
ncbi:MAG: TetR/AcrR family transcriptional regulator [Proteobacteria bacterium]|nr:TetR/AcrR family transcriptional regulator [Pseudomonadota bacterium]